MISFQQFRDKYNGKGVDWDGYFGDQCMDLMHYYIVEVLGLSGNILAAPTAYQAYVNGDPNFEKIANDFNDPNQVPSNGDIMFWQPNVAGVTGSAGHVSIFVDGQVGVNSFNSFDQNFPTGSLCHIQNHTYKGVAGWLRFKKQDTIQVDKTTFEKLVANSTKYDAFQAAGFPDVNSVNSKITTLTKERDDANSKLSTLKDKIINFIKTA